MKSIPLNLLALLSLPLSAELTVHEWGTFTQVIASDGTVLDGLETEEEHLPPFVYSHAGLENGGRASFKGFRRPVLAVNAKMETPVIYFYSDKSIQAQVSVNWKGGSISQWFPQRKNGETPPAVTPPVAPSSNMVITDAFARQGGIDFSAGYRGSITWDIQVSPSGEYDQADLFKGTENATWLHPRIPGTSLLTAGEESESYLFYRGIGRLDSGLSFTINDDNQLNISNSLPHDIPFLMVFKNENHRISTYSSTSALAANESLSLPLASLTTQEKNWKPVVYRQMREGLVKAGLYSKEAEAMIQTWWQSYFEKPSFDGCPRVFWVMPAAQVDEVLPLSITPQPDEQVRVLVGRAEVLTPAAEEKLRGIKSDKNKQVYHPYYHRFSKAYEHRMQQLK